MQKKNVRFAKEDIIAIEELAEQLASELNDDDLEVSTEESEDSVPIIESEEDDIVNAAEELLGDAELPDEKPIANNDDAEAQSILDEADALDAELQQKDQEQQTQQQQTQQQQVLEEADALEKELDACTAGDDDGTCPECGGKGCSKCASEFAPGIEDEIGDEASGGDPSVSTIVDNDIDTATDKEVFGQNTDSEYVAKITARLDRVATALEKRGMKKMAFRVDQLSDRLEASIR